MSSSRLPNPLWAASFMSLLLPVLHTEVAISEEVPVAPGVQRERVNLVLIDVVVTDRKGRHVDDLRPEEFSLRVDGHPHAIESPPATSTFCTFSNRSSCNGVAEPQRRFPGQSLRSNLVRLLRPFPPPPSTGTSSFFSME